MAQQQQRQPQGWQLDARSVVCTCRSRHHWLLLLLVLAAGWWQGASAFAYTSTTTVNITWPSSYVTCDYYTLSYQIWCTGSFTSYVAIKSDCLSTYLPPLCAPSPLYTSMRCPQPPATSATTQCSVGWGGNDANVDPLCLVVQAAVANASRTLTCDIYTTGDTTLYAPSPSEPWPTWQLVLVILGSVFLFCLLAALAATALFCGCRAVCRCCRCCGYEPGGPKAHLVLPQIMPYMPPPVLAAPGQELAAVWDGQRRYMVAGHAAAKVGQQAHPQEH